MDPANMTLTDLSRSQLRALPDLDRYRLATKSLVKDPERVTAVPEPTDWTDQDYNHYLQATPKYSRSDISMAAGHALQFWSWYAGVEAVEKEKIYSTYHGVFSYAEINGNMFSRQPCVLRLEMKRAVQQVWLN